MSEITFAPAADPKHPIPEQPWFSPTIGASGLDQLCWMDDNSAGKAQAGEMRNGDGKTCEADLAVYAELQPIERHRALIDHLFVLRDRGRLTGVGRNLFASPFSELALVGRRSDDGRDNDAPIAWKALHLPPRFGRQPRRHSFHGWMFGIRCRPLDPDTADAALAGLSELLNATIEDNGQSPFDPIIGALDAWIEHLRPRLDVGATAALDDALSAPAPDRGVAALAAAVGVVPRTLQRYFATAPDLRRSNMQPFGVSAARCGRSRLDMEVSRMSHRTRAIPIKLT